MSWNCQSVKPKRNELEAFLHQHSIDIALVNETWLQPHINFTISGFECYRSDRISSTSNSPHGGVAILIKKSIDHNLINFRKTTAIESLFLEIPTRECKIIIGSIYCSPAIDINKIKKDLTNLLCHPGPILLAGDFNAKHSCWNNSKNDKRGILIHDLCHYFSFSIFSPDNPTLFPCRGAPSTVDFPISKNVFCSNPVAINDLSSDHLPIIFKINSNIVCGSNTIPDYVNANWSLFRKTIAEAIVAFSSSTAVSPTDSIDSRISFLNRLIKSASLKSVPCKKMFHFRYPHTKEIDDLKKARNRFRKLYQTSHDLQAKHRMNQLNKLIKKLTMELNVKDWDSKLSNLSHKDNSLYRISKALKKKRAMFHL
jgi:hypothetical protein